MTSLGAHADLERSFTVCKKKGQGEHEQFPHTLIGPSKCLQKTGSNARTVYPGSLYRRPSFKNSICRVRVMTRGPHIKPQLPGRVVTNEIE
ncbi:hypothetical protein VTN96DRAFT_2164 [Rasamsonia emersonii]